MLPTRLLSALCVVSSLAASTLAASTLAAQSTSTGAVAGTVTDAEGRPLAGVAISVAGIPGIAATERDGRFRIPRLEAGTQTVTLRYIGYQAVTRVATVEAGRTVTLDVQMSEATATLAAVEVRGQVAGQAAALNVQRTAPNITSVIDNELVGRLPDPNLAEALARVPGVAMVRDQGEGRFVQIRGTSPDLNSMSINGLRVATPEQNSRQLPMDIIPADQAASIQVSKTLTPDMDADAIGGNVNLVTRTAQRGQRTLNLTTAGGQNTLGGGTLSNLGFNWGKRLGADERFGFIVGATNYRNDRASQNFEGTWCVQDADCGPVGAPSRESLDAPRLWELRDYPQVNRLRQGANATLDYRFSPMNKVFLRSTYNYFQDAEIRFRTRYAFRAGGSSTWNLVSADSGETSASRMDRDIRLRQVNQYIRTVQLGGEHAWGNGAELAWTLGTSGAREERPDIITMVFRQNNMGFAYNFADADRPRVHVVTGQFDEPTAFVYNSLNRTNRLTADTDRSGKADVSMPSVLAGIPVEFKGGVAVRLKNRENEDAQRVFTGAVGANSLGATAATLYSRLVTSDAPRRTFDGDYTMGRTMDPNAVRAFVLNNPGAFTLNQNQSAIATAGTQFEVSEDVYAGYLMASMAFGRLAVVPGMRVEATRIDNVANRVSVTGGIPTITRETGSSSYTNVFPSINATYRLDDATNVRAAVTTSLVRPQFRDMTPFVQITAGQPTVQIGNPDLDATTAIGYDVMAERYFQSVGFVAAGVFAKSIKNFIVPTSRPVRPDENYGPDASLVIQPVNGETASLFGFELAWQQNLSFLPGILSGLGVNANYTYTTSETSIEGRDGIKTPLPEQTGNAGNLGIFFDRRPISLRLGANYSGEFLSTINPETPLGDTRTRARLQIDFSGSVDVSQRTKLFFELINLTNTPLRAYVGNQLNRGGGGDDPSFEFYKMWGMVGLKFDL